MASILTNSSALTALQTLSSTNKALETTQNRISTGLRIGEASDNASYWSIATSMKSDNKANSAVQDALGLGASKVDTAYSSVNKIIESVDKIKAKLVTATGASGDDKAKIETEIKSLVANIKSAIGNATYAGSNLIDGTTTDFSVVASYNRTSDGVSIDTISFGEADIDVKTIVADITGDAFFAADSDDDAIAGAVDADTGQRTGDSFIKTVEDALGKLTTAASALGAAKAQIDSQKSFLSGLSDSIEKGVGTLVDADMNKESARLSALQVQQQLGVQALSIANSSNQNILSLFR